MIIKFKISKDCAENPTISVDKLFQFVVVGEKQSDNKRCVEIYTAIAFKRQFDENQNGPISLKIEPQFDDFTKEQQNYCNNFSYSDCSEYYQEIDIIKQFWGSKSDTIDDRNKLLPLIGITSAEPSLLEQIYTNKNITPIMIEESEKGIDKFIAIPLPSTKTGNKIILSGNTSDIYHVAAANKISFCFWFKISHVGFFKEHEHIEVEHTLDFDFPFISDDFKIYYQVPKYYDLNKGKVTCHAQQEASSEIVKVYSQHRIKYFQEWRENGIYDSALFRVLNNKNFEGIIRSNSGNKTITSQIEIIDNRISKMREVYTLLAGIAISTFVAMGLDATRLGMTSHQELLEFDFLGLNITAAIAWTLIAIGLVIKYFRIFDENISKGRKTIYILLSMPILLHSFIVLYIPTTQYIVGPYKNINLIKDIIVWDMLLSIFLFCGKKFHNKIISLRQRWRGKGEASKLKYKLSGKMLGAVNKIWGIKQ